jgi:hypothetical protein
MTTKFLPTTREIRECFVEEITALGGTVSDQYDDDHRLFLRSTLPRVLEARPRDRMQGGVALRVADCQVLVHPYVFRQVCSNGAIFAQTIKTQRLQRVQDDAPIFDVEKVLDELREMVQACAAEEVFEMAAEQIRSATEAQADHILTLMPLLARMSPDVVVQVLGDIESRFQAEGDRTLFGVMNAVTSRARDTRDPELRWQLEELGGGVPALVKLPSKFRGAVVRELMRA